MDSFYYNLLNIGKKSMSEDEYLNKIKEVIDDETKLSKEYNENLDRLCKVISTNINSHLKDLNIDSKIVNTKDLFNIYEHQFIISSYMDNDSNINYYLIDPTYSQFKHKDEFDFEAIYPADILNKTEEGKLLLNNLLNSGYSKINDNDLKRYIGSIMYEEDINKIDITIEDIMLERTIK